MKISNLLLVGLLLALLALAYFVMQGEKASTRTFEADFISLDTSQVSGIVLYPPLEQFQAVKINRPIGTANWRVESPEGQQPARRDLIANMMTQVSKIKADRVVSRNQEKWAEYKVGDKGTRVQFLSGEQVMLDLVIGKITFGSDKPSQGMGVPQQQPTSYVRLKQDNTVYSTPLFLEPSFNKASSSLVDTSAVVIQ